MKKELRNGVVIGKCDLLKRETQIGSIYMMKLLDSRLRGNDNAEIPQSVVFSL